MISQVSKLFLSSTLIVLLTACGGSDPTITDTVIVYTSTQHASAERGASAESPAAKAPAVLLSSASESERVAEELRMVEMEQALSIEMNRRHAEQAERQARIESNARAGMVQSPGCEDAIGHDAVVCEQRVARL